MNDLHYAVVVGINRYPGIGDLEGARADADQFVAWLVDPNGGGLPAVNVQQVSVREDEEASYDSARKARPTNIEIDNALLAVRDAVRNKLTADPSSWERSRLYFYVAGHGFAPQSGEGALFLANAENDALSQNIELLEYRLWCTTCAWFREVIVFADCCRTRFRSSARGYGPRLDECTAPWKGKSSTYVIGYGSILGNPTYEQPSADADNRARGYFTTALLEGLRGAAARTASGALTASTLSSYVATVVAERTQSEQFPQQAQIYGPLAHDIEFGTTQPPPKRKITLILPSGAGKAKVLKDGREIARSAGKKKRWQVELEDGLYEVETERAVLANEGLFKVAGEDRHVTLTT